MVVARQVLPDPSYLFGVCVSSQEAAAAAASDGASFLVVIPPDSSDPPLRLTPSSLADIAKASRSGMQIPVILSASVVGDDDTGSWLSSNLDGVSGTPASLSHLASTPSESLTDCISSISSTLAGSLAPQSSVSKPSSHSGLLSGLLGNATPIDDLITREKGILSDTLVFLQDAVPEMSETRLLKDALVGLDEPFLLVVVGEFNSGKSTVINALLGAKFLEDGILPTTNEISVLKHSEGEAESDKVRPVVTAPPACYHNNARTSMRHHAPSTPSPGSAWSPVLRLHEFQARAPLGMRDDCRRARAPGSGDAQSTAGREACMYCACIGPGAGQAASTHRHGSYACTMLCPQGNCALAAL